MNLTTVTAKDHSLGKLQAPVTLVEYADFECPRSGQSYYEIEKLLADFGENICFVYRNFPITDTRAHAMMAAVAAEAAGDQGHFWEMHHLLFQNQENLDKDTIIYLAEVLGLDMETFEYDLQSEELQARVEDQRLQGLSQGVKRTPTLFLNGRLIEEQITYDNLKIAAQEILYAGREPVVNS